MAKLAALAVTLLLYSPSALAWGGLGHEAICELAFRELDDTARQRVIDECLVPYLHDRRDAWELDSDGSYTRIGNGGPSAQQALMQRHSGET